MPNTSRYSSTNLYILYIRRFLFAYLIFVAFIIVERYNDDFPNKKSTEPKLNNLIAFITVSNMLTSAEVTTNDRVLFSSLIVGTTLIGSLCEQHISYIHRNGTKDAIF